jgi:hypothetical protein
MRDYPGLRTYDQAYARWLEANAETVRWGSVAAQEAVERICQEVTLRCQQVIDRYSSASIPDQDGPHEPDPRRNDPTTPQLAWTLAADTTSSIRVHSQVQQLRV